MSQEENLASGRTQPFHSFFYPPTHPPIRPPIRPPTHPLSIHLPTHLSIHHHGHQYILPSTIHESIHISIHSANTYLLLSIPTSVWPPSLFDWCTWSGWVACAHGWWPRGCQKDQEVSASTLQGHRRDEEGPLSGAGAAPGGLSCRKGSPCPNQIPPRNPFSGSGLWKTSMFVGRGEGCLTPGK